MSEPLAAPTPPGQPNPDGSVSPLGAQTAAGATPPQIPDHALLRRIGGGSYGDVWLARNVFGEYRAVKVVYRAHFGEDRPFQREFEGIQKFEPISRSHPSQLAILHAGKNDAAGCFYYVMELADPALPRVESQNELRVEGPAKSAGFSQLSTHIPLNYVPHTLRHDLEQQRRLPLAQVLDLGLALTTALAHLHKHGLVHRDVKPSNIVFVNGVPKLADIGLVTEVGDSCSIVGAEGYLAPEGPGTPQADVFSLGKVLYEAAMGRDRRHVPDLPLDWQELPDRARLLELNEILLKSCAHDARQRYSSAEAMHADLERLRQGKSVRWR